MERTDDRAARPRSRDAAAWALLALLAAAVLAAEARAPIRIEVAGLTALGLACAVLGAAALVYGTMRPREQFAGACLSLMQALLFSALGSVLSYLLARSDAPLWDARLAAADTRLGLDWLGYVRSVDGSAGVAALLRLAYASLIPQMVVVILALSFTSQLASLRRVIFAAMLCGTVTVLLSSLFPAVGYYAYLGLEASQFRHVDPWAGYVHLADFTALRSGTMTVLSLPRMQGIITFPSYHAGLAAVTLWGFWISRVRVLRWGGGAIALMTVAATPIDGGHYFVDVLAGLAVAVASIVASGPAVRWRPGAITAWPFRRSRAAFAR